MLRPVTFLLLLLCLAQAQAQPVLLTKQGENSLASFVSYFPEKNPLTIQQVIALKHSSIWQKNSHEEFNLGFNDTPYWLKIDINNQYTKNKQRVLEIAYPELDDVRLYLVSEQGEVLDYFKGGDQQLYRPLKHPNITFSLDLPTAPVSLFLRVQTQSSLQIPLTLWDWPSFNYKNLVNFILQGIFYGMVSIMFIYNLMIWIFERESIHLKYTIYIFFFTIFITCQNGLGFLFIWPNHTWLNNSLPLVSIGLTLASLSYFISDFFNAKQDFPKIHTSLKYSFSAYCLTTLVCLFLTLGTASLILSTMVALTIILIIIITIYMIKIRHPDANYFAMAWLFLIIGSLLFIGREFGFLPLSVINKYGLQFGACIEIMFLSLALADRMARLKKEKHTAQQESLVLVGQIQEEQNKTLNAEIENLRLEKEHSHKLEILVEERTDELKSALSHLSSAHDKLQTISITDALTQLHNRYYFNEHWRIEFKRAFHDQTQLSLIMIDIDHFKKVNDNYGHPAGDVCLQEVALAIKKFSARDADISCRYGGEEFIIILPSTNEQGAVAVAESIRQEIAKLKCEWNGAAIALTASLGVSSTTPRNSQSNSRQFMVNQADQALYQAKNRGRNQVVVFESGVD